MILDYKEATLQFPNRFVRDEAQIGHIPNLAVFRLLHCKNCCQRSIIAMTESYFWHYGKNLKNNTRYLRCNRCQAIYIHWIYDPVDHGYYAYQVSDDWINALDSYRWDHDNRKELLDEQVDRKMLRLMKLREKTGRRSGPVDLRAIRFRDERRVKRMATRAKKMGRINDRRLLDLVTRQAAKESVAMTARRIEREQAEEEERVAWLEKERLHLQIMGDEPLFVCAAMPSDRDNVEVVFLEAQRQRGTKRPFVSLQQQEYGEPRMAGAW